MAQNQPNAGGVDPEQPLVFEEEMYPMVVPAEGGGEAVATEAIEMITQLPIFDMRNGDPAEARLLLIRPTVPDAFKWVPVGGIRPSEAMQYMDLYVKSALYQLNCHAGDHNYPAALRRKVAICLGVCRAVITAYYRIGPGDLIPGEFATAVYNVGQAVAGELNRPVTLLVAANAPNRGSLTQALALTNAERAVVAQLVSCAVGIPPVQGLSLIMTGHHYLSEGNTQSKRAFAAIEKQLWRGEHVTDWFNTNLEELQGACWHKAGHPILISLKERLATSSSVAAMVRTAGNGAAAARLPALEPAMRSANSYVTLMKTVHPLLQLVGGSCDPSELEDAIEAISQFPRDILRDVDTVGLPAGVRTREAAVSWLADTLQRNSGMVATVYGFYSALSEATQMAVSTVQADSLKNSYSLMKLKNQSAAAFAEGVSAYADFAAYKARRRAQGVYAAPVMAFDTGMGGGEEEGGAPGE